MATKFEPKVPVNLDPPKDDPITLEELAQADVYDVTGNKMYAPGTDYNVFVGKDASRALAKTSTKPEDVKPEWRDLPENEQKVLNDWITFFSKRSVYPKNKVQFYPAEQPLQVLRSDQYLVRIG
ncbi:hypothetical protein RRF57_010372 [Xylaria bambusicola]|uniref:Cytochrome b5 heme-binding domain-containing protein n=1 Tax=Xylaria bambusicola TaxID=326684 RepID=A0AAN7UUW4_9PEZI